MYTELRAQILHGLIKPGSAMLTQRQLSEHYQVSEPTAWTAMSRLAHEGLVSRSRGRGSFVAERLPVEHKTLSFLRLRSSAGTKERATALAWVEELSHVSEDRGWKPYWRHVAEDEAEKVDRLAEQFAESSGVIIYSAVDPELPRLVAQRGVPVVAAFLYPGGLGEKPACYQQITYDRRETSRLAAEHLVSVGYRRIGLVGLLHSPLRTTGFLDVVRSHKLPIHAEWLLEMERSGGNGDELERQVTRALKAPNRPEAFCCATEHLAYAVERVATDLGLKVPEDLAIIACDGGMADVQGSVSITTVGISRKECCQKAIELIEQDRAEPRSGNGALWDPVMMPLHLTIAESCGAKLKGKVRDFNSHSSGLTAGARPGRKEALIADKGS